MNIWEVSRAEYLSDDFFRLLREGWEPYSVTEVKAGYEFSTYCFFRRMVNA